MHDAHDLLKTLAIVLCLAAVTTITFQRLRQPVVFGYLLAGLIASPYTPIPLVADVATVRTLSELGVILLMFSLGCEFRISKLIRIAPTAGIVAITECSSNHSTCDIESVCRTGSACQRINGSLRRALDDISLAQLAGQEALTHWRPEVPTSLRPGGVPRPVGRA